MKTADPPHPPRKRYSLRRRLKRPIRLAPFANPVFLEQKQPTRDRVAEVIANHFDATPAPTVFVLPSNRALCAKTINGLVPNAVFYGVDYFRLSVVEKVDAVDEHGKTIHMQGKSIDQYINDNAGSLSFDAAFLDYKNYFTQKRAEINQFAAKMLKPVAVLAVTVQSDGANIAEVLQRDLKKLVSTVTFEGGWEYRTTTMMSFAIFHLRR